MNHDYVPTYYDSSFPSSSLLSHFDFVWDLCISILSIRVNNNIAPVFFLEIILLHFVSIIINSNYYIKNNSEPGKTILRELFWHLILTTLIF